LKSAAKHPTKNSLPVNAVVPRNAERAGFHADDHRVTNAQAVEIVQINREALDALMIAPRMDIQPAGASDQPFHIKSPYDYGGVVRDIFLCIEPAVHHERGGENPGQRNESGIDALENFDFLAAASAAIEEYRERERKKKNQPKEHQHEVEVQRRIDLADIGKEQRTTEKNRGLLPQPAAEHYFGGSRG